MVPANIRPTGARRPGSHQPQEFAATSIRPLDLPAQIDRFGRDTVGGIGISTPAPA